MDPATAASIAAQVNAAQQQIQNIPQPRFSNGRPLDADVAYIQQMMAAGAPPSLVIPPTRIPLYPGYMQVSPGPGFVINQNTSKYNQLLSVIEEMSKDLRPTYLGSKTSGERFKRGITQAKILIKECLSEH